MACGARSSVRYLSAWGLAFQYGRQTTEGPLSDFVQAHRSTSCSHAWVCAYDSSFRLFSREYDVASGFSRYSWVGKVEAVPGVTIRLRDLAATQPAIVYELQAALHNRSPESVDRFFDKLISELRVLPGSNPSLPVQKLSPGSREQ